MPEITFRPITDEDLPFLARLYASTRQEELAVTPWTEEQKQAFLQQQFEAQHRHYQEYYPEASFDILQVDGEPAGRLYASRWSKEIRIVDISLLPEYRNRGIGGRILKDLLDEGRRTDKVVSIHVEKNNPALRLYERLGFERVEDKGVYHLMEWKQ